MTKHALLLLLFIAEVLVPFPTRVFAGPAEDVQAAMLLLKSKAAKLGAPSVKGGRRSPERMFLPCILEKRR